MVKLFGLLFVIIAPTLAGIFMVAVLAMSSPMDGGTPLSQQGMTLAMVVAAAVVIAFPVAFMLAKKLNSRIST